MDTLGGDAYIQRSKLPDGIYYQGLARQYYYAIPPAASYGWDFNNQYKCIKGRKYFNEDTGIITFPNEDYTLLEYNSNIGWNMAHDGIYNANSNANIANALSRHFKVKYAESDIGQNEVSALNEFCPSIINAHGFNFEKSLRANQVSWMIKFSLELCEKIWSQTGRHNYAYGIVEGAELLTKEKHIKQLARVNGYIGCELEGRFARNLWVDYIQWKIKPRECAKVKTSGVSPARIVVDMGVEASLPRVHFANSFKSFMKEKTISIGTIKPVKVTYRGDASYKNVCSVFSNHDSFSNDVIIDNSSDDSLITWWENGVKTTLLVDIASNDSSHSLSIFKNYATLSCMDKDQEDNLFLSFMCPFRIYSHDMRTYLTFLSLAGYLPSGIGDTTAANNCIYLILAFVLAKLLDEGHKMSSNLITYAGFLFGFRFSYSTAKTFSEIQFLKQSPIYIDSKVEYFTNLGVLFRYSGVISGGDIPGMKYPKQFSTLTSKFVYVQSLLTFGFFKYFRYSPLIKAFCPLFSSILKVSEDTCCTPERKQLSINYSRIARGSSYESSFDTLEDRTILYPTQQQVYARYTELSQLDIDTFEDLILDLGVGMVVYCRLINIVLQKDYSIGFK